MGSHVDTFSAIYAISCKLHFLDSDFSGNFFILFSKLNRTKQCGNVVHKIIYGDAGRRFLKLVCFYQIYGSKNFNMNVNPGWNIMGAFHVSIIR